MGTALKDISSLFGLTIVNPLECLKSFSPQFAVWIMTCAQTIPRLFSRLRNRPLWAQTFSSALHPRSIILDRLAAAGKAVYGVHDVRT